MDELDETPEAPDLPPVDGVEVFGPPVLPVVDSAKAAEARP